MSETAADAVVRVLVSWGVKHVFGMPGDTINPLLEALRRRRGEIDLIQVRHQESAALMASGYAKYSGKLGVCLASSGAGAIHLLNGLYDAKMDGAPVLALTGQTYSDLLGTSYPEEVRTLALFADVAKNFNHLVSAPDQVEALVHRACKEALGTHNVAHLSLPVDIQSSPPHPHDGPHLRRVREPVSTAAITLPHPRPPDEELDRAARLLEAAKRPAILVGAGAIGAGEALLELAERLAAPVAKALLGKQVAPDSHPVVTGGLGMLGTRPSEEAMARCDTLLLVGTSFPYLDYLPAPGAARAIQIDIDPGRIGARYPVEIGLVGDARATLESLVTRVQRRTDRSFLESIQALIAEWRQVMDEVADGGARPIPSAAVARAVSDLAPDDANFAADSGSSTVWAARQLDIRGTRRFSCSGNLSTMGCALPYAMAAKLAFPEQVAVALLGDGAFTMLLGEFLTAVAHALPVVVVVLDNGRLAQSRWEQMVLLGNPSYGCDLKNPDFARFAELCGGVGFSVEEPAELRPALEDALDAGRPAVVHVKVDPDEPPWPPRLAPRRARELHDALAQDEPGRPIGLTLYRDRLDELL